MKIVSTAVLKGVREYSDGAPVELIRYEHGLQTIRVTPSIGVDYVEVDLTDLLNALGVK